MTGELKPMPDVSEAPIAAQPKVDALVKAVSQREVAEAQGMILIAQRFPRDEEAALDRILIACQRPGLAEGAIYTYPRGGTNVTGPSIRLAEAIAQQWCNLDFGVREIEQRHGESTIQAYAWDMERNVRQVKSFQVKHLRRSGTGKSMKIYALDDPRDIYETVASQGARRVRACILGLIPGDVVERAVAECEKTMEARADTSPEGIKKMLDVFAKHGVSKEQIEKRLGRKLEGITPAQMLGLLKIHNSLKDGMSSPADWFAMRGVEPGAEEAEGGNAKVREALKGKGNKKDAAPPPDENDMRKGEEWPGEAAGAEETE